MKYEAPWIMPCKVVPTPALRPRCAPSAGHVALWRRYSTTVSKLTWSHEMPEIKLIIRNKVGLHARPAVLFVQAAQNFTSEIRVLKDGKEGNAKSFKSVLGLAVNQNDEVTLRAEGEDAEKALVALTRLVEDNFGEK
jgi:phosphocarrier protein